MKNKTTKRALNIQFAVRILKTNRQENLIEMGGLLRTSAINLISRIYLESSEACRPCLVENNLNCFPRLVLQACQSIDYCLMQQFQLLYRAWSSIT